jgi:DNA-binding IscR family transcriptional regulator
MRDRLPKTTRGRVIRVAADQSFALATHAMVMMAFSDPPIVPASAIAAELSLSPVVVRRTMARLVKAGLVLSIAGPSGGYSLPDPKVSLGTIMRALHGEDGIVVRRFDVPTSSCEEGLIVDDVVAGIYAESDAAVDSVLDSWTIARIRKTTQKRLTGKTSEVR